ncbi:HEAT repeat domain-containing protein [candidate division WOR-3 bacterium]|nr:HEAT repeat domain-containing protein [candidate division WOR-3 bacterium]
MAAGIITEVKDVVLSLAKAIKAIHMYGLHHPSSKNLYVPLYEKTVKLLRTLPEINLQIEQFSILYQSEVLYTENEKDLTIAFKLFRDGIRSLNITDGLTLDELVLFLEIVSRTSREHDIALDLWESHFKHIDFYIVEEEDEMFNYSVPELKVDAVDYDKKLEEIISREKLDLNATIAIHLDEHELKTLTHEIHETARMSFIPVTITTLLNFLKTERSQEVIDSLLELLERCIDNRDFTNARRIVHRLTQDTDTDPLLRIANEATIVGFKDIVNTAHDTVYNEFIAFVGMFPKISIPHFLKLFTEIKRKERLSQLRTRLVYIMQDDPEPIIPFLASTNVTICIHAIALLGSMNVKDIVNLLQPLMHHHDPGVRTEIIGAFQTNKIGTSVAKYLDDESMVVRIRALQALAAMKYLRAYENLLHRIKSKYFRNLEFTEQKEYFNCLAATGGRDVVKQLRKMLFKWLLFGNKRYATMRKLAAYGLATINDEEARAILHEGMKRRNKDIRTACDMALRQV